MGSGVTGLAGLAGYRFREAEAGRQNGTPFVVWSGDRWRVEGREVVVAVGGDVGGVLEDALLEGINM